ncbi:hypothetical protein PIB30_075240, partial [Stylosanthes scabra]|nr:hypothetical protein [Stylosanthes scabra]
CTCRWKSGISARISGIKLKCGDDLSCRSLRATDGRNRVNLEAVNATPLPITGGP